MNKFTKLACVAGVVASGFVFGQRSINNLTETVPILQDLANCAIERTTVDFVIIDGRRTLQEHLINVRNGRSWTRRSKHVDGLAIDFAALVDGKITYEPAPYHEIAKAFYSCADEQGTEMTWGGEWRVQDLMHVEVKNKTTVK